MYNKSTKDFKIEVGDKVLFMYVIEYINLSFS